MGKNKSQEKRGEGGREKEREVDRKAWSPVRVSEREADSGNTFQTQAERKGGGGRSAGAVLGSGRPIRRQDGGG